MSRNAVDIYAIIVRDMMKMDKDIVLPPLGMSVATNDWLMLGCDISIFRR